MTAPALHAAHASPAPVTPHVAEQFDDAPQQRHASTFGMWLFLATELLVFSVLFTGYTAARCIYPDAFSDAGGRLYKWIGITNAGVLLISSTAMALAVETPAARPRAKSAWMFATVSLGIVFCLIKGVEYTLDIRESLLPIFRFDPAPFPDPARAQLFLCFYWIMTGLHAFHVIMGILVIFWLACRVRRASQPDRLSNAVTVVGLYWHFVDIIWLFLLPLLYLNP